MSNDTSLGASLYRRHTAAALSAQTRNGARMSFGEALHARHAQFAQMLLRRAGAREQGGSVQRTFVVARRVASVSGGGDDADAPVVVDALAGDAVSAAPSMHDASTSARQDARPVSGERVVSRHFADATVVGSRSAPEVVGDAMHVAGFEASPEAAAHGARMADAHASNDAGPASVRAVSGALAAPVGFRPSGSMPPAPAVPLVSPPVVMAMRPALESPAITRATPAPLAAALAPIARGVTSMALHAAHADVMRAGVTERAHAERSPDTSGLHDARSVSADGFIARRLQDGSATPFVMRHADSRDATDHMPDAPRWRRAATTVAYELPVASPMHEAASDPMSREHVGGSIGESAHAAFAESAVQSARPPHAARDGAALPFAARPIARAVLSTSRSTHPAVAADVFSPMALVARQTVSSSSAPFTSANRTVGMRPTAAAATLIAQRASTEAGTSSSHVEAVKISVPDSAFAPAPDQPSMVFRRGVQAVVSMPEGAIASGMERTAVAPTVARVSKDDESLQAAASNAPVVSKMLNAPDVSSTSTAAGTSSVRHSGSATLLPRVPNASAAHVALMPMPATPAIARTHRSDVQRGSEPVAGASIAAKETPLSSAIHRAVDVSGEAHRSARAHDIEWPSNAGGAFVDSDHETRLPLAKETSHPQAAIDRQSHQLPLTHETLHPLAAIDRRFQQLPLAHETSRQQAAIDRQSQRWSLTHETSNPRGGIEPETHLPLTRGTSHPQAATDRQTQAPLTHAIATAARVVDKDTQTALAHDAATPASSIDHAQPLLEPIATSRGPASRATQPTPFEAASPREPTPANLVQRTPVASPTVKSQPPALRAGELPLRIARALHGQRATRPAGVPSTASGERAIALPGVASEPASIDRTAESYGVLSPITPVMRDLAAPTAPSEPPPRVELNAGTPVTPAAGPAATPDVDADELAERAWQLILDKLAIEQERRGYTSWT